MIGGPHKGESEGYIVKSKERDFPISNYPLEQTEFYYGQKQGTASYDKLLSTLLNFKPTVTLSLI